MWDTTESSPKTEDMFSVEMICDGTIQDMLHFKLRLKKADSDQDLRNDDSEDHL